MGTAQLGGAASRAPAGGGTPPLQDALRLAGTERLQRHVGRRAAMTEGQSCVGIGPVTDATPAALLQRRGPILAVLGSAVGLVITVGVLVFPDTVFAIFPTAKTFREIGRAMHQVTEQARVQVAPTEPLRPLLLAAFTIL